MKKEILKMHDPEAYFWSMVRPKKDKKKRICLNCRDEFISNGYRLCGSCHSKNAKAALHADKLGWEPKKIQAQTGRKK